MKITTAEKISIGGMRFSSEQIQMIVPGLSSGLGDFVPYLHWWAENKVNLPFICFDSVLENQAVISMCREDFHKQQESFDNLEQSLKTKTELISSTGSLTLFPHKSRARTAGLLLEILGRNKFTLYSLNSSLSALVVNIDFDRLNEAARVLQGAFSLPENHSPFRQEQIPDENLEDGQRNKQLSFVETEAVYWEPVIKIYGSCIKKDLELTTAWLYEDQLSLLGKMLQKVDNGNGSFEMISMQRIDNSRLQVGMLHESRLAGSYRVVCECLGLFSAVEHRACELLYFHGPHFQDRYGVAYAAVDNLQRQNEELLAVGCSGTSIYLVTPEQRAQSVADVLEKVFLVPNLS